MYISQNKVLQIKMCLKNALFFWICLFQVEEVLLVNLTYLEQSCHLVDTDCKSTEQCCRAGAHAQQRRAYKKSAVIVVKFIVLLHGKFLSNISRSSFQYEHHYGKSILHSQPSYWGLNYKTINCIIKLFSSLFFLFIIVTHYLMIMCLYHSY